MKLCLACFGKCEDSALSCPHCGYGSDSFIHPTSALPVGTVISGRYETGKAEFSNDKFIYCAFDSETRKSCRITEYYPSNSASRKGRKVVFSDSETANSVIEQLAADNPDGFRENGTFYTVSVPKTDISGKPKKKKTGELIT